MILTAEFVWFRGINCLYLSQSRGVAQFMIIYSHEKDRCNWVLKILCEQFTGRVSCEKILLNPHPNSIFICLPDKRSGIELNPWEMTHM